MNLIHFCFYFAIPPWPTPSITQRGTIVFPSLKRQGLTSLLQSTTLSQNSPFSLSSLKDVFPFNWSTTVTPNSLIPPLQSGFIKFHSTESLIMHLLADVFHAFNHGHVILLALYDAFDTIYHAILLKRLFKSKSFGVTNSALFWFCSFLTD